MHDENSSRGRELYHEIWKTIAANFYDLPRLTNLAHWEHLYDERITDDQSALEFAQIMVSSLGDLYTRILPASEVDAPSQGDEADGHVVAKRLKGNIGYIAINNFSVGNIADLTERSLKTIADCDGFILNLSDNQGGSLGRALDCLSLFIEEGPLAALVFRHQSGVNLQEFYLVNDACIMDATDPDGSVEMKPFRRRSCLIGNKPVALVIGPDSASCCETFIAAMLANRQNAHGFKARSGKTRLCWSFGERTSGKGIMQATHNILGGRARLRVSVGKFKAPDGHWFGDGQSDQRGIRPDYRVKGRQLKACKVALRHMRKHLGQTAAAA